MGTAYIETTVTAEINGVTLFQCDCTAQVEYTVDAGELVDLEVSDFKFEEFRHRFTEPVGPTQRVKIGEVWCPDILRPVLLHYVNKDAIEEKLVEQLLDSGEIYYQGGSLRRDYHSAVL